MNAVSQSQRQMFAVATPGSSIAVAVPGSTKRIFAGPAVVSTGTTSGSGIAETSSPLRSFEVDYGEEFQRKVRASTRVFIEARKIGENQCEVSAWQYLDAGGSIPSWLVDMKIADALAWLPSMRDKFNRDEEIDKEERQALIHIMRISQQVYTDDENLDYYTGKLLQVTRAKHTFVHMNRFTPPYLATPTIKFSC